MKWPEKRLFFFFFPGKSSNRCPHYFQLQRVKQSLVFQFREKQNKTKHDYVFGVSFTSSPPHSLDDLRCSAADTDMHHQLPAPKQSQQQAQRLMQLWIYLWKETFWFISQRRVGESGLWSLQCTFPWTYISSLACDLLFPSVTDFLPDIACLLCLSAGILGLYPANRKHNFKPYKWEKKHPLQSWVSHLFFGKDSVSEKKNHFYMVHSIDIWNTNLDSFFTLRSWLHNCWHFLTASNSSNTSVKSAETL